MNCNHQPAAESRRRCVRTAGHGGECQYESLPPYRQEQQPDGSWCVVSESGQIAIGDESYQVTANIAYYLSTGKVDSSECGEVAAVILAREYGRSHDQNQD